LDDVTLAGGANLAVLARCNLDIVKIDRSLVSQIGPQRPLPEWLEGVATLVKASRLQVVAEGVETEEQMTVLRTANIQAAQGFHISRPIPAAAFTAYHHASIHGRTRRRT
jgi:EAL domain-containing protein (putative c-di-GMP-specific phosphodiesterase class I)